MSIGLGAAGAAALLAIVGGIAGWATRSPSDFMSLSPIRIGVLAAAIGLLMVLVLSRAVMGRKPTWTKTVMVASVVAVGLGAWGAWDVIRLYKTRDALPFVDTTGATVIAGIAALAAVAAVALGLAAIGFMREAGKRTALCAFLVVAVAVPTLAFRLVEHHRAGVWRPDATATATPPTPVPDSIGSVRYRVPVDEDHRPDIYAAANGFVVDTRTALTAYDGTTGEARWHATDFGTGGRLVVAHRDEDDIAGILVLQTYYALIAFDGSTGEVLWHRQYTGDMTAATGSVDALGIVVFTASGADDERTQLHSIDPATGQLRWSKPISCSNPSFGPGTPGQFTLGCSTPSIIDAHTGDVIDTPGKHVATAGSDAYTTSVQRGDGPTRSDVTLVLDPAGQTIDEIPGVEAVSRANNGFLLMYSDLDGWLLRDYRKHQSFPVPIDVRSQSGSYKVELEYWLIHDVETVWLNSRLIVTDMSSDAPRLHLIDPARPEAVPVNTEIPCARRQSLQDLQAVPGAVAVVCRGDGTEVVGMVP